MQGEKAFRIGPHEALSQPPSLLKLRWHGDIRPEDVTVMFDEVEKLAASGEPILILNNLTEAAALSPEMRKAASQEKRAYLLHAMAVIGAGFRMRVLSIMLTKASQLVGSLRDMEIEFFDTEEQGLAWLETKRSGSGKKGPTQRG